MATSDTSQTLSVDTHSVVEQLRNGQTTVFGDLEDEKVEADYATYTNADYSFSKTVHCNICNDAHFDTIQALIDHIESAHPGISPAEYFKLTGLHHCTACGAGLSSLDRVYCDDCGPGDVDRIVCQNCGTEWASVEDEFCSPSCVREYRDEAGSISNPIDGPENPSDTWVDKNPYRTNEGIPASSILLDRYNHVCRWCHQYGANDIHALAVHVSQAHADRGGWSEYLKAMEWNRCRVCGRPIPALSVRYCSRACQLLDPDPPRTCAHPNCDAGVEPGFQYCSQACSHDDDAKHR